MHCVRKENGGPSGFRHRSFTSAFAARRRVIVWSRPSSMSGPRAASRRGRFAGFIFKRDIGLGIEQHGQKVKRAFGKRYNAMPNNLWRRRHSHPNLLRARRSRFSFVVPGTTDPPSAATAASKGVRPLASCAPRSVLASIQT